jgi:hypothetical protein
MLKILIFVAIFSWTIPIALLIAAEGAALVPVVTFSGADTKITETDYLKIDSRDKWEDIWLRHTGHNKAGKYDYFFNEENIPVVNFDKYMVIAILQSPGENTAGIDAYSISEKENEIIFDFETKRYQVSEGMHNKGNAYGFFVLPRSNKKIVIRSVFRSFLSMAAKEPVKYKVAATIEKTR